MFGDLHLEKQFLVVIRQLLEGSGWIELLVEAGITTSGDAQSFLTTSHIKKTRGSHEFTLAALYLLKCEAFSCPNDADLEFSTWENKMKASSSMYFF